MKSVQSLRFDDNDDDDDDDDAAIYQALLILVQRKVRKPTQILSVVLPLNRMNWEQSAGAV